MVRREIEEAAAPRASDRWDDEPEAIAREALDLAPSTEPAFADPTSSHLAKQAFLASVAELNAARPGTVVVDERQTAATQSSYRSQGDPTSGRVPGLTIRVRAGLSTAGALAALAVGYGLCGLLMRVGSLPALRGGEAIFAVLAFVSLALVPLFASSRADVRVDGDAIRVRAWWRTRTLSGLRRVFLVATSKGPTWLHAQSDSDERALFVPSPRRHADAIVRVIQNHVRWSDDAARDAEAEASRAHV